MTTALAQKAIKYIKHDADGNLYSIPEAEEFAFTMAVEEIQNADWGSDEWGRLNDELFLNFGQYRKED
jgi:hypothetical protein